MKKLIEQLKSKYIVRQDSPDNLTNEQVAYNEGIHTAILVVKAYSPTFIPYQLCPKCGGQKTVAKPPHVPGDLSDWNGSSLISYPCGVCDGNGIIPMRENK